MDASGYDEIFRPESWKELYLRYRKVFAKDRAQNWIFRGQNHCDWKLATCLERQLQRLGRPPHHADFVDPGYIEEGLVREFLRRLAVADVNVRRPDPDNVLEWLSLMQHHGACTRLLDWTYSFFVALFFAVDGAVDADAAVYAIDGHWCNFQSRKKLGGEEIVRAAIANDPYMTTSATFRSFFSRVPEVPLVYRINPFVPNPRIAVQQGLFLCPGALSITFEENLESLRDKQGYLPLRKWIIPKKLHGEVLRELSFMNIGRHSLFPGIDGFAQSLSAFLQQKHRLWPRWRQNRNAAPFERWLDWEGWHAE